MPKTTKDFSESYFTDYDYELNKRMSRKTKKLRTNHILTVRYGMRMAIKLETGIEDRHI